MSQVAPRPERVRGDEGLSLVEILVSIVVLSTVFIAAMGGLATATGLSEKHKQQSEVEAVVGSAVEKVKAVGYDTSCSLSSTLGAYNNAAKGAATDAGWNTAQVNVTSIQYWNGTSYSAVCKDDVALLRLQLLTVKVDHPRGKSSYTLSLVKRG